MAFKMKGFKAHNMYKTEKAETHKEHLALKDKGYDHNPYKKVDDDSVAGKTVYIHYNKDGSIKTDGPKKNWDKSDISYVGENDKPLPNPTKLTPIKKKRKKNKKKRKEIKDELFITPESWTPQPRDIFNYLNVKDKKRRKKHYEDWLKQQDDLRPRSV